MNMRSHRKLPVQRKSQRGVMLLEALIALLIFSMGILALVGLQAISIKNSSDAKYRSEAAFLANQVIARMWVSDKTNLAGLYNTGGAEYLNWRTEVQDASRGLPGSIANPPTIVIDNTPGPNFNRATVTVFWQTPGDPTPHRYVTVAQIN